MNKNLPSDELVIRPASFNDIPYIQDIVNETWPVTYIPVLGRLQVQYMLKRFYNSSALEEQMKNKHYFFLALKDYTPIGFASFSHIDGDTFKLQKLYVVPGTQKTGAGKALLQTVEVVAKSMGATKLQLNVNRKNIAKSFYEKNGFTTVVEEDIDIDNGFFMNDYVMEKDL